MFDPQSVLGSDANFDGALDDADGDNAWPQPDILQPLLAVAALVAVAPHSSALAVEHPNILFPISFGPVTVGVTASSLGSALEAVKGSSIICAPLSFYI